MTDFKKRKRIIFITRLQCMGVLFLLALLEIGPVPIAPFFGMYLVLWRPPWFKELVERLYGV
ncbi:MAG: hypothetical protein JJU05_11150 [Verrucomicrobia bacterium]|nr:hypothetical protein [Verrucomicrobiota bacterium]MCH8527202.1 hypothetical protein [Kiritimatiellia bacterium]